MKNSLTALEIEVIKNIINSEYMDAEGEMLINWAVWSFSVTNSTKELAGALGSLVKKGICFAQMQDSDHTCGLTNLGYEIAKFHKLTI